MTSNIRQRRFDVYFKYPHYCQALMWQQLDVCYKIPESAAHDAFQHRKWCDRDKPYFSSTAESQHHPWHFSWLQLSTGRRLISIRRTPVNYYCGTTSLHTLRTHDPKALGVPGLIVVLYNLQETIWIIPVDLSDQRQTRISLKHMILEWIRPT